MRAAAAVLAIALSGCAGLTNSYFDPIEYGRYIDISTSTKLTIKSCGDKNTIAAYTQVLSTATEYAVRYSENKIQNQRVHAASKELQGLVVELADRYSKQTPSEAYCQLKLAQVSVAAETIAHSIGKKED